MEAAGVVDQTHCLVIRAIADYADSHKNQTWKPYAAGTAAAFARKLVLTIQPSIVAQLGTIASTTEQAALWSQHSLAVAYLGNRQYDVAATLLEQVVGIRNKTVSTHPDLLASQLALGQAYTGNKQYVKASKTLEQVFEIRGTILHVKHPTLLISQHSLAVA